MCLVHHFISVFSNLDVVTPVMIALAPHVTKLIHVGCNDPWPLEVLTMGLGGDASQVVHAAVKLVLLHPMPPQEGSNLAKAPVAAIPLYPHLQYKSRQL